jgi:mannose/fructose/N-acetylgalactosamine-specific phosphotransferase system component IID
MTALTFHTLNQGGKNYSEMRSYLHAFSAIPIASRPFPSIRSHSQSIPSHLQPFSIHSEQSTVIPGYSQSIASDFQFIPGHSQSILIRSTIHS